MKWIKGIIQRADKHGDEEMGFIKWLSDKITGKPLDVMQHPNLKRQATKYHQQHDLSKKKAAAKQEEARQKMYQRKATGQWELIEDINQNCATPLFALRRRGEDLAANRKVRLLFRQRRSTQSS